jgi:hypothetical protein
MVQALGPIRRVAQITFLCIAFSGAKPGKTAASGRRNAGNLGQRGSLTSGSSRAPRAPVSCLPYADYSPSARPLDSEACCRIIIPMPASPSKCSNGYVEPLNQQQICIYRRMTGEQRLRLSFDMIHTVWRIAADAIRNQAPHISDRELKSRIRERRMWANSRPR